MQFSVHHQSVYRYDVPVRPAAHTLRLTPRPEAGELRSHRVLVSPLPTKQVALGDVHGNQVLQLEFVGSCRELRVDSHFELQTRAPSPLPTSLPPLPWSPRVGRTGPVDPSVAQLAADLAQRVHHDAVAFLDLLTDTLYTFDRHVRTEGEAHPAWHTLATRRGACRDLTILFMDAAQSQGMSTRFVSGYQAEAETVDGQYYLHAWPEIWLGGMGYWGWDPTHGRRATDGHVPLCAAPTQAETMPIEGGFYFDGTTVNSTLDFTLDIQTTRG